MLDEETVFILSVRLYLVRILYLVSSLQSAFGTPTSPQCHLGMREAHHSSFSLDGYFGFGIIIGEQCQFLLDWYPLQYTSPEWKSMLLSFFPPLPRVYTLSKCFYTLASLGQGHGLGH